MPSAHTLRQVILDPIFSIALAVAAVPCVAKEGDALTRAEWQTAIATFDEANRDAPNVYTRRTASACRGRWALHADKVDNGAFPTVADELLPWPLRLPNAISEIAFFEMDLKDPGSFRGAYEEAKRTLAHAFKGDRSAAQSYFARLGECYSAPEAVADTSELGRASDAPVESGVAQGDFDEPENIRRLAFIEQFVDSLKAGERVARYFGAEFDFTFRARLQCGDVLSHREEQVPANEIDLGMAFWISFSPEQTACDKLPEPEVMEYFDLHQIASRWPEMQIVVDDHDFAIFVLSSPEAADFLLIHIEPHRGGYVVVELEYDNSKHRQMADG